MQNKYKFTSIPLNVGILETIWLEHTKAFQDLEKQYKVNVQYSGNRIILKGAEKNQCVKAQQFIENKVSYQFKMDLLEFNSEPETQPFKKMIYDEVYLELCQQYPGLWSFNRYSLTKILNKMNEKYNYIAQLPNLPMYFVLIWIPQSNYITLKQLILDLLKSYEEQKTIEPETKIIQQYINITALETILIFVLLDCQKIQTEFRVLLHLIQKSEQIILVVSGDQTSNIQKPIQIVTKTLNAKTLHQYFHLNQKFDEQKLIQYETSISTKLQTQVFLYSYNQIVNKAKALENKFNILILNQLPSSKEDQYSTYCLGPKGQKIEVNDLFTQLIRDTVYQKHSLESSNSYVIKKEYLNSQVDQKGSKSNSSKSDYRQLKQIGQPNDQRSISPKIFDKEKENKQSSELKQNQINGIIHSESTSKINSSDSLSDKSKNKSSSTSLEIPENQFNQPQQEEQKLNHLISTSEISQNISRQIIQFSQNQYQIIYKSKDLSDNFLDWEQSFQNYVREFKLQIDGNIKFSKQILQIETIEYNIAQQLDEFFKGFQFYLVAKNKSSLEFTENLTKIYSTASKLTNQSNIGILSQLEYEQLQINQAGQFIGFFIWNFLNFDENIKKSITHLINLRNEVIDPPLFQFTQKNKIIKILSQDQLNFLQMNNPTLKCQKISKYCDELLTSFYYVQLKNDLETFKSYQIQLINIGKNLVSQFIFEEKKKLNQQKRLQISNNCWKLIFYSNIQEFYLQWLEDLYSLTFNLEDYKQIGNQGFNEVAINLGNFSIKSDSDLKHLDNTILNNMNYKCQKLEKLTDIKPGNYLIAIMRNQVISIDNVTQLDPANTLIRGYVEINKQ